MIDKIDTIQWKLIQIWHKLDKDSEERELIAKALELVTEALDIMLEKASKAVGE